MSTGKIINITEGSNFAASKDPTWGPVDGGDIAKPSSDYFFDPTINAGGATQGRNNATLALAFPASVLGLTGYKPQDEFNKLMNPDPADTDHVDFALGSDGTDGAEQYMGTNYKGDIGVAHLTFSNAPDLSLVKTDDLNIPSPYVPDISAGAATAQGMGGYAAQFLTKYSATSDAFPPAVGQPGVGTVNTGLDLTTKGAAPTLNPAQTVARLGDWLTPTLGKWTDDGTFDRPVTP